MIHRDDSAAVFALIDHQIDELRPAPAYRELFDLALGSLRESAEACEIFLPVDLPMAVADVLHRPAHERHVAAAASTLLWAGADLMDDAADGELPEAWSGIPASRIALVATNLLATLPHLVVGRLDPDRDGPVALYGQAVSRTLFAMSDGQAADLDSAGCVRSTEDYIALVRRKSAAEFGLFAATPAILAGADAETVAGWTRFGFAFGTMVQVFSDTVSSLTHGPRNDLRSGKRTLPVLHVLERAGDEDHASFAADLDSAASGDQAALERAIETMTRHGAVRASLETVELLRFRAAKALPATLTDFPNDHPLRRLLTACSIV